MILNPNILVFFTAENLRIFCDAKLVLHVDRPPLTESAPNHLKISEKWLIGVLIGFQSTLVILCT